ncbi:MAG: glycosyltransferase, partial [Thermodesulfobacteriota bacterium]
DYIRQTESRIYSLTNFSGEFNAFRKSLGLVLDERALSEDLDLTIQIIKKGYKVIYVPSARVYEPSVENTEDLIKQKKRRAVGALQVVFKHIDMIAKPKLLPFNMLFFFHRTLRLFTPILTLILLVALCYLFFASDYENKYEALVLTAAVVVTVFIITGIVFKKGLIRNLYYFLVLQHSYVLAWIEFITGKYKVTWEKTESSRDLKNVMDRMK